MKVLSPLAMIGMNLSESEKKIKQENENEIENENIHDDEIDHIGRNKNRISTQYSENNGNKIYGNESGEENERRERVDGDGVGLESRRLYLDSSSSPDAATPHSFSSFPLSPALSISHSLSQPLSTPLLHHPNKHTEYQIMEERKSITHERRKRQNVWNRFVNTTAQSDTVVTNVSPLILNINKNSKNTENIENVNDVKNPVNEMNKNSGNKNENKNDDDDYNGNENDDPWCHILPHTNPLYRATETPVCDMLQMSTEPSRTSKDGNGDGNGNGDGASVTIPKFMTSIPNAKSKTLLVDTNKNENANKNEFNKLESKSTSIFGMSFNDIGVSTGVRSNDVRDSGSRRKSSFGSRDALDSNDSSPLPFSPPSSTSIFSLDSLSSPASLLSSPQLQLQQRISIGSPSLVIDTREKQSEITTKNNDNNKNKSLTTPETDTKKSPVDPAKSTGNPTVNTVKIDVIPVQSFIEQVTAFYLKHNPTKVDEIPKLLEKYRGQEPELIRKLEKKYGVVSGISTTIGDTAGAGTGVGTGSAGTGVGTGEKAKEGNSTQGLESPALTSVKPSITRSPGSLLGSLSASFGSAAVPSLALNGKRRPV